MAQDLEPLRGGAGDDRDRGVAVDDRSEIARLGIDPDRDRLLGEPPPDRRRDFATGNRGRKFTAGAVR